MLMCDGCFERSNFARTFGADAIFHLLLFTGCRVSAMLWVSNWPT